MDAAAFAGQRTCGILKTPSTPLRFLSIGECMAELAPAGAPDTYKLGFAGDTFNTAWYLRALRPDAVVSYFSRVGDDTLSDRMLAMMTGAGIDTAHMARSPARSVGLYMISLRDGERSFSYWRDTSPARQLADDPEALDAAIRDTDLVYFSGITLAIVGPDGRRTLLDALRRGREAGKTVAFDPNLRPRLWPDSAEMCRAVMDAARVCDIALPSFEDEAAHFGDSGAEATAERYAEVGAATVVVKNGDGAALYRHDGRHGAVMPPAVKEVVDTTSAGDSFNAGVLAGLCAGQPIETAIGTACQVAGQVIGHPGALVSIDAGAIQT